MNSMFLGYFSELIFCFIDIILLYRFGELFLVKKERNKSLRIALAFITSLIAFVMTFITDYSSTVNTILLLSIIIYILFIFEGELYLKFSIALLYYLTMGMITSVIYSLFMLLTSLNSEDLFDNISIRVGVALTIKLIFLILVEIVRYFTKRRNFTPFLKSFSTQTFFVLVFLLLLFLFDYLLMEENYLNQDAINYIMLAFGAFFGLMIMLMFRYFKSKERIIEYKYLLKESNLKQQADFKKIEHNMNIMKTKHDLKNHLISLNYLLEKNKNGEATEYIKSLLELDTFKTYVSSKNEIINALLNIKVSQNKDIQFNIRLDIDEFPFKSHHLTIILGNILDNAVEAVQYLTSNKKNIDVIITENNQYGKIVVSNHFDGEIKKVNGILFSKKRINSRGLGMISITQILKECDGSMDYSVDDDKFRIVILLKKF